jgi:restriction endonuclease S subunit
VGAGAGSKFFSVGPFDPVRFAALSKGLEIAVVLKSALERTFRIDAEFFRRSFLSAQAKLAACGPESITDSVSVSDGNHFTISDDFVDDGVPYFRGQDISGEFFLDGQASNQISQKAYERNYMRRSHLKKGDVLISIVGTIGSLGLIDTDNPATCSCKLAILRPHGIDPAYLAVFLRSNYGALRIQQLTRGAVQRGLILEDMDQIRVPRFPRLENEIARAVHDARVARAAAAAAQTEADEALLDTLGLRGWSPPAPLTYTRSLADVVTAGRFDAQFHAPGVTALQEYLASQFKLIELGIGSVSNGRTVSYSDDGCIPMLRSGDIGKRIEVDNLLRAKSDQPIVYTKPGDILISSIGFGSIGRVHVVRENIVFGTVSEVTIVRQTGLDPHYVTSYLRSAPGQLQIERFITGATGQLHLYPRDVRSIFIPVISDQEQIQFRELADVEHRAFWCSRNLLTAATRSIEIAVEIGEAAALAYLAQAQEAECVAAT